MSKLGCQNPKFIPDLFKMHLSWDLVARLVAAQRTIWEPLNLQILSDTLMKQKGNGKSLSNLGRSYCNVYSPVKKHAENHVFQRKKDLRMVGFSYLSGCELALNVNLSCSSTRFSHLCWPQVPEFASPLQHNWA